MAVSEYKSALSAAIATLAQDPLFRVIGYGLRDGKGANGTMKNIPNEQVVETTVAESLLLGMAQGLAMKGLRPLAFIERADFLACGLSAISNHLDKCREISRGEFNPCVIIRVTIGNRLKPLFTGPTHTSNPAKAMKAMLRMPVYEVTTPDEVQAAYHRAAYEQREGIGSSMICDFKDFL